MNKEFQKLFSEFENAKNNKDIDKEKSILAKMVENIYQRNGGLNDYCRELDGKKYLIQNASVQELLEINGEMNRIETSQKLTKISDEARAQQTGKNKYGPNNIDSNN